jgi:hypothetical protein
MTISCGAVAVGEDRADIASTSSWDRMGSRRVVGSTVRGGGVGEGPSESGVGGRLRAGVARGPVVDDVTEMFVGTRGVSGVVVCAERVMLRVWRGVTSGCDCADILAVVLSRSRRTPGSLLWCAGSRSHKQPKKEMKDLQAGTRREEGSPSEH